MTFASAQPWEGRTSCQEEHKAKKGDTEEDRKESAAEPTGLT